MGDLMKWVTSELSTLLPFPVTNDMAKCILMIESPRDLEDYMQTLLDLTNPAHLKFVRELTSKKQMNNVQGYKKAELDNYIQSKPQDKKDKKKGNKSKNEKPKEATVDQKKQEEEKDSTKKKTKFRNIFDPDDKNVILLKGWHFCNCQASKHALVNNCLNCGRIVCEQEGVGPCSVCSTPVYRRGDLQYKSNVTTNGDTSLEEALELRDRLLEYDKTSESRTKVIDDQSDYFSTNSVWLTKEQKEELKRKEEELLAIKHSRTKNLILDFTGRCLIDDDFKKLNDEMTLLQEVSDYMEKSNPTHFNDNIDPNCTDIIEPVYEATSVREKLFGTIWKTSAGNRIQDKQLLEMSDSGMCLSLHQPWASLLISGIKCHEGRSWYTSHRGRLWIAAAAKNPTPEEIQFVQNQYRLLKGDDIRFPKKYPVGCLLGCVNLVDCLAQEEYRNVYENGESDSPFVFICETPTPCPVLFPIKGQHKIYKLDPKIHQAAAKCIQKLSMK
uniref:Putative activating signal cointegrator 1-like protein n=1 Tax=Triatoma infestans TaxID=30076 RepID=A0A023F9G0_TRIIF